MPIRVIAIPALPGAASGYDHAPAAYVEAGLYDRLRERGAGVVGPVEVPEADARERTDDPVETIARLGAGIGASVGAALGEGDDVLVVGSNCTALVGILAGFERALGATAKIGLVWFDAHGDFNTPKTTITGRIGGMPVAVAAGLAFPRWREAAGLAAPVPTDRIVMVDVRNLDPKERTLIEATDVTIAAAEPGRAGEPLESAVGRLAESCDVIYLHVDEDVLDERLVPNHGTREPNGPDLATVQRAIRLVLNTGKVRGLGLVSVNVDGEGGTESLSSALGLLEDGVAAWKGVPARAG